MRRAWLFAFAACATQGDATKGPAPKVHLGDAWFELRAGYLGMSPADARDRDGEVTEAGPPRDQFWDEQLALESASLWRLLCNDCHGGKRSIARAAQVPEPPVDWGGGSGRFFGRERERAEIFRTIFHGAEPEDPEREAMPAWGSRLAREQIWSLIWFIEHASSDVHLLRKGSLEPKDAP